MKICPTCKFENRDNSRFCMKCGHSLVDLLAESETQDYDNTDSEEISTTETLKKGVLLKGRFQIIDLINRGGMGYLYKGFDVLIKKQVAVKEMIDRFTREEDRNSSIERFKREAEILCNLDHPAIPKFFEYFTENHRHYLVMDFVEGLDLRKVMKKLQEMNRDVPLERIVQWAMEICDVLDYLHSHSPAIVYRDLKPSNVIINPRGSVQLVDFGIARLFVSSVKATMIGTQGYAPPEQYRGKAEPRSDIYSLGATIHHLITGKDPQYEAPFHFDPVRKLKSDVPQELESIVDKCLRLAPDDRYQDVRELKKALSELVAREDRFSNLTSEIKSIKMEISELKRIKTKIINPDNIYSPVVEEPEIDAPNKPEPAETPEIPRGTPELWNKNRAIWKQFRGNEYRMGNTTLATTLQGHLKWKFDTGVKITSSPVVDSNKNVYIGNHSGEIHSLNRFGKVRWSGKRRGIISATGVLDEKDRLYVATEDGTLYALDYEGFERWHFNTGGPVLASIMYLEGRLITVSQDGWVYCFNQEGQHLWRFNCQEPVSASPAAGRDGCIFIAGHGGSIIKLKTDGEMIWKNKVPRMVSATPAVYYDCIYIGCEDTYLYCLDFSGRQQWRFKTNGWVRSSPAVSKDGTVYIGSSDQFLYAIERKGAEKWRFNAEDIIISSPVVSDEGTVYFATNEGLLYALYPYGQSRWWFNLKGGVHSSPALGPEGVLYIGSSNGTLYAVV